jgi:hypothetical protein
LQPLNGGGGLVGKDLDEVGSGLVTGRLQGVIVELLYAVLNLVVDLSSGQGTVDTGGGLGRVTTEETYSMAHVSRQKCERDLRSVNLTLLVEDYNITTGQVDGVGSTETRHYRMKSQRVIALSGMKRTKRCQLVVMRTYSHHQQQSHEGPS